MLLLTMSNEALKTEECLFIEDMLHMALKMKVVFQNSSFKKSPYASNIYFVSSLKNFKLNRKHCLDKFYVPQN